MQRELADRLVERGLVTRFAMDQLLVRLRPGDELADQLVRLALVQEADLLRFLAAELGTRFVSSEKLARVSLSDELLAVLPLKTAEAICALPLMMNPEKTVLAVVMANPKRAHSLDEVPRIAKLEQVHAYVGLPGAIRAAIRKHYHGERSAFSQLDEPRSMTTPCPGCGAPTPDDQLECAICGMLINPEVCTGEHTIPDGSVVRAMLSEPTSGRYAVFREVDRTTAPGFQLAIDGASVPSLVPGLDVFERRLSPFEAYLAAFVDGTATVAEVTKAAGVAEVEAQSVFATLQERRVVELRRPGERAAPAAAPPPGEPEEGLANVVQRAVALERRGEVTGAVTVLKLAIARSRDPAPLYNRLALVVLNRRRDYREAEELLRRAIELRPDHPAYQQNLMKVLALAAAQTDVRAVPPSLLARLRGGD